MLADVAQRNSRTTYLPDWYLKGGMYVLPPLVSFLLLMFIVFISRGVIHIEDANHNGIPDALEFGRTQAAPVQAYTLPAPRPAIGFNTNINPNHQYGQPAPKDQPRFYRGYHKEQRMDHKNKSPELLIMTLCWIAIAVIFLITILTGWM